jgi:heptosyltransferase-2
VQKILIIQTAFIGDVVLATAMVEKLAMFFPDAQIDFLLRKGNEGLLANNPHIHEVLIWNKKENKQRNLFAVLGQIRKNKYDKAINLQRFFATGLLTAFSRAKEKIGFDKNPLSFFFTKKIKHVIAKESGIKHEVERNNDLIAEFTDDSFTKPKLYPSENDHRSVEVYKTQLYVTITPNSVWFTKQYPAEKWIELMDHFPGEYKIYLLGGKENTIDCEKLKNDTSNKNVEVLTGKLSFLQSSALMKNAAMNYVNDSAPLHFASALNAPATAIFCSTIPAFGFTPLSDTSYIIETLETLTCRPCGLHGYKACPEGHFKCALTIDTGRLIETLKDITARDQSGK